MASESLEQRMQIQKRGKLNRGAFDSPLQDLIVSLTISRAFGDELRAFHRGLSRFEEFKAYVMQGSLVLERRTSGREIWERSEQYSLG